jgi:hypothetical protein
VTVPMQVPRVAATPAPSCDSSDEQVSNRVSVVTCCRLAAPGGSTRRAIARRGERVAWRRTRAGSREHVRQRSDGRKARRGQRPALFAHRRPPDCGWRAEWDSTRPPTEPCLLSDEGPTRARLRTDHPSDPTRTSPPPRSPLTTTTPHHSTDPQSLR